MARIRSIKPDFWTDEHIVELSPWARLLFIGLWNFADDDGRMEYSPKRIKMQIFPSDSIEVSELFGEIRRENLIVVYVVDGKEYLQIKNFAKHQKVDKRTPSRHPPCPGVTPNPPELPPSVPTEGKGREGNGEEGKYIFKGRVVRLNANDYSSWKKAYHCILDLDAELQRIDTGFAAKAPDNWFVAASNMLNAKHQKILGEQKSKPKGGITPLGVGG